MDYLKALKEIAATGAYTTDRQKLPIPGVALLADKAALTDHVNELDLPLYYLDRAFVCVDCQGNEVWTAKQQKWWYEEAKGAIDSTAIRCRKCRNKRRDEKSKRR